jgi:hypothetical protein
MEVIRPALEPPMTLHEAEPVRALAGTADANIYEADGVGSPHALSPGQNLREAGFSGITLLETVGRVAGDSRMSIRAEAAVPRQDGVSSSNMAVDAGGLWEVAEAAQLHERTNAAVADMAVDAGEPRALAAAAQLHERTNAEVADMAVDAGEPQALAAAAQLRAPTQAQVAEALLKGFEEDESCDDECPVCNEPLGRECMMGPCMHRWCGDCHGKLRRMAKFKCPLCNQAISPKQCMLVSLKAVEVEEASGSAPVADVGAYGTKIKAVVQCIQQTLREKRDDKVRLKQACLRKSCRGC